MEIYKTEQDVREFFFLNLRNPNPVSLKRADQGIFVSSKVRKEILLGESQGKGIFEGTVRSFEFENVGGGVWKCKLNQK